MGISSLVVVLLALLGTYFLAMSRRADQLPPQRQWRLVAWFSLGLVAALVGFVPSPNVLGPDYRFTTNMVQFELVTGIAPPLLFLGLPQALVSRPARWRGLDKWLAMPVLPFLAANAIFLGWHLPGPFEWASRDLVVWTLKQAVLLGTGLLAWWPVLRAPAGRPGPVQVLYLFFMSIPTMILGALFTFSESLIYSATAPSFEICAPASPADQQLAGLLMWQAGAVIYLGALSIVFIRWLSAGDAASNQSS